MLNGFLLFVDGIFDAVSSFFVWLLFLFFNH